MIPFLKNISISEKRNHQVIICCRINVGLKVVPALVGGPLCEGFVAATGAGGPAGGGGPGFCCWGGGGPPLAG